MENKHLLFFKTHATKHTSLFPRPYSEIVKRTIFKLRTKWGSRLLCYHSEHIQNHYNGAKIHSRSQPSRMLWES